MHNSRCSPKISIVIPMYNAENFISDTIRSILLQSFEDFELILVDDRSTDRTVEIVRNFKDPRLKLIQNVRNLHEWDSRNIGFQFSSGEYIYFVDHDDLLLPDALEKFWRAVEKSDAESIHFNAYYVNLDARFGLNQDMEVARLFDSMPAEKFLPEDVEWRLLQEEFVLSVMAWQKICRRDFLLENQIYFPPLWISSDSMHFFAELCLARKIFVTDAGGYIYRQNPTSQMRTDAVKKLLYVTENFKPMLDFMEDVFSKKLISKISRDSQIRAEIGRASLICMKFAAEAYEAGIPLDVIDSILEEKMCDGLMLDEKTIQMIFHLASIGWEEAE